MCEYQHLLTEYDPFQHLRAHSHATAQAESSPTASNIYVITQVPPPDNVAERFLRIETRRSDFFDLGTVLSQDKVADRFYYHYIAESSWCLVDKRFTQVWSSSIRKCTPSYPYLFNCVLALAGLNLSQIDPSAFGRYVTSAVEYHNTAISSFRLSLDTLSPENCEAMIAFAGLNVICCFALPLATSPRGVHGLDSPLEYLKQVMAQSRGFATIYRLGLREFDEPNLAPRIYDRVIQAHSEEVPYPEAEASLILLRDYILSDVEDRDHQNAYLFALGKLSKTLCRIKRDPNAAGYVLMWCSMIGEDFIPLLRANEPVALVMIAHWAVCFHKIQHTWWAKQWGVCTVAQVSGMLGKEWQSFLEWPLEEVGLKERRTRQ